MRGGDTAAIPLERSYGVEAVSQKHQLTRAFSKARLKINRRWLRYRS